MSIQVGAIGEAAVKLDMIKKGYEIYNGQESSYFDFIVVDPNTRKPLTVEVKSTRCRTPADTGWLVRIGKSRFWRTEKNNTQPFDNENVDILAVYIEREDRVVYFKGSEVKQRHKISIKDSGGKTERLFA
jgi:hypothetical protein